MVETWNDSKITNPCQSLKQSLGGAKKICIRSEKGLRQTALRPDVSTQKTDAVSTIDLIGIKGEEDRFIDVRNEICFYSSFAIECCGCQSDPGGNIDDATRKSKKFLVATDGFSYSREGCAGHWIALICGTSAIDFVIGGVEGRMKCFLLINELPCSFYCGKNNEMNKLGFVNPQRNMKLTGGVFLHRVWLNGECKSPTSLYQNDQRKRCYNILLLWFEPETLHVSVVGVRWNTLLIEFVQIVSLLTRNMPDDESLSKVGNDRYMVLGIYSMKLILSVTENGRVTAYAFRHDGVLCYLHTQPRPLLIRCQLM